MGGAPPGRVGNEHARRIVGLGTRGGAAQARAIADRGCPRDRAQPTNDRPLGSGDRRSWMHGGLNLEQITLACGLGLEARNPDFKWRAGHPRLLDWFEPIAARPSFVATAP